MKITIEENQNVKENEVIIKCNSSDESIQRIAKMIQMLDHPMTLQKDGSAFSILPHHIYYFESIDNTVYAYTENDVFQTSYKLYELEERLSNMTFLRVHKNTILNTSKIKSFKATLNGRVEASLKNNEKIMISRNYVAELKKMLGGSR